MAIQNSNIRPYIIINGVHSDRIQGLLIQQLPPITKPKIRTSSQEIDGRDGDIVTQLGYSAYEKAIKIGLYGDYDVDDVIEYLNQAGQIVFSNEPDKYYLFATYAQIDFERLINYKEANVKFHVQPFKFSDTESEKTFTFASSSSELSIRNNGNIYSRPKLTISGSGTVNLSINSNQVFVIDMSTNGQIIIDGTEMNAYAPDGSFLNRKVVGNYDDMILNVGANIISYSCTDGTVTQIAVDNYSRWI